MYVDPSYILQLASHHAETINGSSTYMYFREEASILKID